jgi:hypothetical protein
VEVEEIDVDGDGAPDVVVVTETVTVDVDGDGVPDGAEVTDAVLMDLDGDGTADSITITRTTVVDVDGDGIPDIAEIEESRSTRSDCRPTTDRSAGRRARLDHELVDDPLLLTHGGDRRARRTARGRAPCSTET